MTSKELRAWLEQRGVAVVNTRTNKRTGRVSAWSCNFYGNHRTCCFTTYLDGTVVHGSHVNEFGKELPTEQWNINHKGMIPKSNNF